MYLPDLLSRCFTAWHKVPPTLGKYAEVHNKKLCQVDLEQPHLSAATCPIIPHIAVEPTQCCLKAQPQAHIPDPPGNFQYLRVGVLGEHAGSCYGDATGSMDRTYKHELDFRSSLGICQAPVFMKLTVQGRGFRAPGSGAAQIGGTAQGEVCCSEKV